MFQLLTLVR